jgi:hypothetical protein
MLIVNMTPEGEAVKDSELLTKVLEKYNHIPNRTNPLIWNVDRHDIVCAIQWLLKNKFIQHEGIQLQHLGHEIRIDSEFDVIDHYHSDVSYDLVFGATPIELYRHHTWKYGDIEVCWLKVPGEPKPMPAPDLTDPDIKPIWKHDCSHCIFLGTYQYKDSNLDIYYCGQGENAPTVVARYGDDRPEYSSGWPNDAEVAAFPNNPRVIARERARARHLPPYGY